MRPFQVRVEGIKFDSAHFATFDGNAEPLHGHSYSVAAEVEGSLSEEAWVIDYGVLKRMLRELCKELDHRFLLQSRSRLLEIDSEDSSWKIRTPSGVGYVLPKDDVVALPIDNSTSERLAEWLSERLWANLNETNITDLASLCVEVWEGPGQRASYTRKRLPLE